MRICFYLSLTLVFLAGSARGGVFHLADSEVYESYIVVHPAPYDGNGGSIDVSICVDGEATTALPALKEAVATWNAFAPTTENCTGCQLVEQGPGDPSLPRSLATIVLHELGHCALGLGHNNWIDRTDPQNPTPTSFTNTRDVVSFDDGPDDVRGSSDDLPSPLPGSRLIHWFRIADNDPFVIDGSPIDRTTYTRRILDLPGGHSWPVSGNRATGLLLGNLDTQSVMYSHSVPGQAYASLTADEINTIRFGMAGIDETSGTLDDYMVSLSIGDCADADVEIRWVELGEESDALGVCLVDLDPFPSPGLVIHHRLTPFQTEERAVITINGSKRFDVVFANGFESGDVMGWSSAEP